MAACNPPNVGQSVAAMLALIFGKLVAVVAVVAVVEGVVVVLLQRHLTLPSNWLLRKCCGKRCVGFGGA